ncbi:MAG: SprT-like domain-containing protein [Ruminococcus sp.]|nr:SprT-like domain-containing protein [Ruminococcus sp.]
MRDLKKYAAECMSVLDDLGIRYAPIIRFSVNTRASTRLGLCRKRGECYEIEISSLLLDERTPADSLRDTLWHELLHTCRGCMKHTGLWKKYAEKVNASCGACIRRATANGDRKIPAELLPPARYIVRCESCGTEYLRQKQSPLVRNPEQYRCGKCKGSLKRVQ